MCCRYELAGEGGRVRWPAPGGSAGQGGRGALRRRGGDDLLLIGLVARDDVRVGRGRAAGNEGSGRRRARGDVVGAARREDGMPARGDDGVPACQNVIFERFQFQKLLIRTQRLLLMRVDRRAGLKGVVESPQK